MFFDAGCKCLGWFSVDGVRLIVFLFLFYGYADSSYRWLIGDEVARQISIGNGSIVC